MKHLKSNLKTYLIVLSAVIVGGIFASHRMSEFKLSFSWLVWFSLGGSLWFGLLFWMEIAWVNLKVEVRKTKSKS